MRAGGVCLSTGDSLYLRRLTCARRVLLTGNMPRRYRCRNCGGEHAPPTGKRCQYAAQHEEDEQEDDLQQRPESPEQPEQPEQPEPQQVDQLSSAVEQLLAGMMEIRTQMVEFGDRMERVEGRDTGADNQPDSQQHHESIRDTGADNQPDPQQRNDTDGDGFQSRDSGTVQLITPESLRQNVQIMAQAAEKLSQFGASQMAFVEGAEGGFVRGIGKKSGAQMLASDAIQSRIDWPHFYVRRRVAGRRRAIHYADLTPEEFMQGFLSMLRAPKNNFDREGMLELLRTLMQDASDFGWETARDFYESLGTDVERGDLRWEDTVLIQQMRMTYCRVVFPDKKEAKEPSKPQTRAAPANTKCCASYQKRECDQNRDHIPYTHACAYCFRMCSAIFRHPEADCIRKTTAEAKNARGRE